LPIDAPEDKREAIRATVAAMGLEFLCSLYERLVNRDPEGAIAEYSRILERQMRERMRPAPAGRAKIEDLYDFSKSLRDEVHESLLQVLSCLPETAQRARLAYARIWNETAEALTIIYARLYREIVADSERALIAARDAALEASRLKSAFVANVTHEIRTPLNVILGYADLMAERLAELRDESGAQYADSIHRAGNRLLATIGAILDLSRIESGAYEISPAPIRLAAAVERQVRDLGVLARKKGLELVLNIETPDATVMFDEQCLSNTITNLLQNAIKFTDSGGVALRIFRENGGGVCLEVADTGVGIDPLYLPNLFEPFSQEAMGATRRFEGAGLGLALVKRYVELNGARVDVVSEKRAGTTFRVHFPQILDA
jgi:signal transduction histidine kinase